MNNLGIYELRNYARAIGVHSPTTKKRQQLLNEISAIEKGTLNPVTKLLGRKPRVSDREKILDEIACLKNAMLKYEILATGIKDLYEKVKRLDGK